MTDFYEDVGSGDATTIADTGFDSSYEGGFSGGEGGYSVDPDEGGYSFGPDPVIGDDGGYSIDQESGGSSSAYDIDGGMSTNPPVDGGYSPAPPVDTGADQSEWSPQTLPEVTVEGEPSSTYTLPEVTVEGEPNPWVDPATGAETDPMTGTVTFPPDDISGPGGAPGHGYDGPSVGPLSPEEAEQGAEGYKQQQEYEEELRQWVDEPFEGRHEPPPEFELPRIVD
jgi:hypothetical protein